MKLIRNQLHHDPRSRVYFVFVLRQVSGHVEQRVWRMCKEIPDLTWSVIRARLYEATQSSSV